MGLQKQVGWVRDCYKEQDQSCNPRLQSGRRNRLWRDFCSSSKDKGHSDVDYFCSLHGIQIALNGCEKCILEWLSQREVYVAQPPGYQQAGIEEHVYKLDNTCMNWNKLPDLAMGDCLSFSWKIVSLKVKLIIPCSLGKKGKGFLIM